MTGLIHIVVCRKPVEGTVTENCLKHGCGVLNVDGCRIETSDKLGGGATSSDKAVVSIAGFDRPWMHDEEKMRQHKLKMHENVEKAQLLGRFPANLIVDKSEEVQGLFPETTSAKPYTRNQDGDKMFKGGWKKWTPAENNFGDSGSASRFFFNFSEQESIEV